MACVRAELGPDALILATRRVAEGVEVTAALEPPLPPALAASDPARERLLAYHDVPTALRPSLERGSLEAALAAALPFAPLPLGCDSRPVLLAGPPGAGKTLTVARLATRLVMAGTKPLVITADGQRAGAVEQLAAFTRLLGIELVVANHPVMLGRALARRQPGAPTLVDAPGADPFDPAQREEIAMLAATAGATVALVLPGGCIRWKRPSLPAPSPRRGRRTWSPPGLIRPAGWAACWPPRRPAGSRSPRPESGQARRTG